MAVLMTERVTMFIIGTTPYLASAPPEILVSASKMATLPWLDCPLTKSH